MNRRDFLRLAAASTGAALAPRVLRSASERAASHSSLLDRRSVVRRHNPHFRVFNPLTALTVGNGEFAFTADITGLQTFAAACEKIFPLCTMAHWAWHSTPSTLAHHVSLRLKSYSTHGRVVGYATDPTGQEPLFDWLRENPHGLHLGQLGFVSDSLAPLTLADISNSDQRLELWTGRLESNFELNGQPVHVETCAHPALDAVAIRIVSPLLASGKLRVRLAFPYGSPAIGAADWNSPDRHRTELTRRSAERLDVSRTLDETRFHVAIGLEQVHASANAGGPHEIIFQSASDTLAFTIQFSPTPVRDGLPDFAATREASAAHWENFWSTSGFVDFGDCTDARAPELERRTILSLYQTALHCAGSLPSAETGLLCNSWYGKFHLEMHWWHGVHFAAWNRFAQFERSMSFYEKILPAARDLARSQGYHGARWPKMTDASGRDSPSPIGPLLIWQQPHPIYYAELAFRERPDRATLERWRDVVLASADFMADFAFLDPARDRFVLGPPLKTVPENTDAASAINPTFELSYWRFGLRIASAWRDRLGLPRQPRWGAVLTKLAPLPVDQGRYLLQENQPDTFAKWNWEHPSFLGAFGMLPGDGVDAATMRRTLHEVMATWKWDRCWGWDFPLVAMTAARLGEPETALRALLMESPKNRFLPNGHNYQRPDLSAYLPGNGGLLCAISMMAQGWSRGPAGTAPGFPGDGKWKIRSEGLREWI